MVFVINESINDGVDAIVIGERNRNPDPPAPFRGNAFVDLFPGSTTVGRFEDAASRPISRRIDEPRRTTHVPQRGIDSLRVSRIEIQIYSTDVVILEENLLPGRAAILRAVDTAIGARGVNVAGAG